MVSGQCKGMYSDQPDRPRSVCSGDRLRTFFLFGAVLMLTSITGVWLFAFHAGSFGRRTGWTIVTGLILFCMLWISGGKTSQTVLKVKKDVAQMTEQLRYGEDNMPSGSLAQASF